LRCKCQLLTGDGSSGDSGNSSSSSSNRGSNNALRPISASTTASSTPNYRRGQSSQSSRLSASATGAAATGQWFQSPSPSTPRLLLLTYHLEDNSLSLNEENPQNSLQTGAGTGKSFLRRDRCYVNELRGQRERVSEEEIFLGNELKINGFLMRIVEMDESSCQYCEEMAAKAQTTHSNSVHGRDGEGGKIERGTAETTHFIYFNLNFVVDHILDKVLHLTSPPLLSLALSPLLSCLPPSLFSALSCLVL
jgi:hypothetical protein